MRSSAKDYDKAIAVCHEILAIAEHFDRYPSFVAQRPETMLKPGSATRDFADYYESQLYCKIARAYRQKIEQGLSKDTKADLDSVNKYLDKWRQTKSHETPINLANALYELYFTGRKAEFNDAKETVAGIFKSDSIVNDEYRLELFLKLQKEKPYETMDNLLSRCGFKDQSTFRRQFKAIYGMTPSEYRKAKQNPK